MRIGIVGAAGAMGEWLTYYFKGNGHAVTIYDLDKERLRALSKWANVSFAMRLRQLVSHSEFLVVSVPIEETVGIVKGILESGGKGKSIVEISSVKKRIVQELRKFANSSTRIVSLHPLFGPGAHNLKGQSVAVIPVKNRRAEMQIAEELFPAANLFIVDADVHDRIVALTIVGTFVLNMAWLGTAVEFSRKEVRRFSGPAAKLQSIIAESYLAQDLELYASICRNNNYTTDVADVLIKRIGSILEDASGGESLKKLSSSFTRLTDAGKAYSELYDLVDKLRN